jgi:hypothetical protein
MPTITATTIRMIFRALLPPVGVGAGADGVGDELTLEAVAPVGTGAAATAAPHLLQNFVPGFRVAPQELQNAIRHLVKAR